MMTSEGLRLALVGVVSLGALTLTGCASPCAELPRDRELASTIGTGYEVEREVESNMGSTECELQPDGSWQEDN